MDDFAEESLPCLQHYINQFKAICVDFTRDITVHALLEQTCLRYRVMNELNKQSHGSLLGTVTQLM